MSCLKNIWSVMDNIKLDHPKFLRFLVGSLLVLFLFLSVYKKLFRIAPYNFFSSFDHFSQSLVLGKIIASENNKELKPLANLAFATVGDASWDPGFPFQSYLMINNKKIMDTNIILDPITDANWINGVAKNISGVVVKINPLLSLYLGKKINIPDQGTRTITSVNHSGLHTQLTFSGSILDSSKINQNKPLLLSGGKVNSDLINFVPYRSQFGLQGIVFPKIYSLLSCKLSFLYKINSFFFALIIIALVFAYSEIFSFEFALVFLLSIALSPWLTSVAKNLYWISFSWFLPALMGAYLYLARTKLKKFSFILLLYLSFVVKCLAGYEYISSVILLSAAPFLYAQISSLWSNSKWSSLNLFFLVCFLGVLGFMTALLIHANMRSTSLIDGLTAIYQLDVKRRTYGDPNAFASVPAPSLSASLLDVLKIYFYNWPTDIIKGIPGTRFCLLFCFAILIIIYRFVSLHSEKYRDLGIFVAFLLPPISWLILAKAHSFAHTQLNFSLWYFGTIAAILYICLIGLKIGVIFISNWSRNKNPSYV